MGYAQEDIFSTITDRIVSAIETGNNGEWQKPWTTILAGTGITTNATTKLPYNGMNAFIGMVEVAVNDYATNLWATYKQWEAAGAQVRKGERGTKMVKWGRSATCGICSYKGPQSCGNTAHQNDVRVWASGFTVFNAAQVEGYEIPEVKSLTDIETIAEVEAFMAATGAIIENKASNSAHYSPSTDSITLPLKGQFADTRGYYGTALHELTHWAGGKDRLDRTKGKTFGDSAYAWEELVAELGATLLAATFGIEVEPHEEHVAYLGSWLRTMKADPKALYSAAKQAQEAVTFLLTTAAQATTGEVAAA